MRNVRSNSSRIRRALRLLTSANAAVLVAAVALVPARLTGQAPQSKLSNVLAALASSVTQEQSARPESTAGAARPLAIESLPLSVQDAVRGGWLRINANNEVQVYVLVSGLSDDVVDALTTAGVIVELQDRPRRRVQARVPVVRLQAIAQLPFVTAIRLPTYGRRHSGGTATEGDAILHADAARAQLGVDGTNVRVGVISDGIKGVFATGCVASCAGVDGGPISTGDLPTAVGVRTVAGVLTSSTGGIVGRSFRANGDLEGLPAASCTVSGIGAEGTALLEIVHDLAPGAKLSFANFDTDLEFMEAVNFLAASNDIVLDDISFYGEPYDGTSAVSMNTAAALNNPSFPIRAYYTSAGNAADAHYLAPYTDSRIDGTTISGITNIGHLHLFQQSAGTTDALGLGSQTSNVVSLPQNGEVAIFLNWDDPFGASSNNYDLYLVQQSTGRVVASSTDTQNGGQDPVEFIDYVNRGSQDTFRIVVQNVGDAARPRTLNIFSFQPECATAGPLLLAPGRHERLNFNTPARSLAAQSDAGGSPAGVVSVAAICSASPAAASQFSGSNESCNDTSNSTIEFFSSRGPTVDGRPKPDITAIDGVSVTGAGGFGKTFFGTSAAVAHLGGVAALALQSAPCLLARTTSTTAADGARGQLRSMIMSSAVPLSPTPPDTTFGAGRVDALAAVQPTLPTRTGGSTMTLDGNSPLGAAITPAQLGFADPNQCNLTSLSWTGGCGTSPGTTMTCPFGASSVTVSASNNGIAYGGASDLDITVTDFSTDVTPGGATLDSGRSATFVVTVAPQGGSYRTSVDLSCNAATLPPGVTCSFSPSSVTPNNAIVQSVLTVSTTASSMLLPGDAHSPRDDTWSRSVPNPTPLVWVLGLMIMCFAVQYARRRRHVFVVALVVCLVGLTHAARRASASPMDSGIAVFPGTVTFGSQTVGTTAPSQIVRVTNTGADPLTLTISTGGDFSQVTNCASSLNSGDNCSIAVSFTPSAAGTRTGSLIIADNAAGSPHTVTLSGTGVAAPTAGAGTPAGSYTLSITGTVGTLTHSVPLTLTVQ